MSKIFSRLWAPGYYFQAAVAVLTVLECLIVAQAYLAYRDGFLTVTQMRQSGVPQGLPFVGHFAMWTDIALISPLAAYLTWRYWLRWPAIGVLASVAMGTTASIVLHLLYTFSTISGVHVQNFQLSAAGYAHLVYMAIAFSIFLQFLLFTNGVERRILGVVAILLVVHVLVGTHMLLGVLKLGGYFDWYPDDPLKSFFGWLTIAAVVGGLAWRYFQDESFWRDVAALPEKFPMLKQILRILEFWVQHNFETTEKYLKLLDYIASYVGFGAFFAVFVAKLQVSTAADGGVLRLENWRLFIINTALPCVLILIFGSIFFFGRQSVRMELAIGPKLFPPGRIPEDWGGSKDRGIAFVSVVGFLLMFLLLTWFADDIKVASVIIFVLACNDWRTRRLINDGILHYFSIDEYAATPGDRDYKRIMARRAVAEEFLFGKPHLWKEAARATGCGVAAAIAIAGYLYTDRRFDLVAYFVLIVTLVLNEWFTVRWRYEMYWKMRAVDGKL